MGENFAKLMGENFVKRLGEKKTSILGKKIVENPNFFVYYQICLKFDIGGNIEMPIKKRKPKLKIRKQFE